MQLGKRETSVCRRGFSELLLVEAANNSLQRLNLKAYFVEMILP